MTDSPGLVALYDIRPGNGSGPFLQPRSPHRAVCTWNFKVAIWNNPADVKLLTQCITVTFTSLLVKRV